MAALGGLISARVDPDELLAPRRVSYRSALTASLATRLVPVLARDALRMGDAARCRPQPAGRLAVARAALAGALDRAVDVAAALEVRGYALGGRPARGARGRGRATTCASRPRRSRSRCWRSPARVAGVGAGRGLPDARGRDRARRARRSPDALVALGAAVRRRPRARLGVARA